MIYVNFELALQKKKSTTGDNVVNYFFFCAITADQMTWKLKYYYINIIYQLLC